MTMLMQAHHEWATRPADERFTSLDQMLEHMRKQRSIARTGTQRNRCIEARPVEGDRKALAILGVHDDAPAAPSHWAFGQLCSLVGAPAGYLRSLPSELGMSLVDDADAAALRDKMMRED